MVEAEVINADSFDESYCSYLMCCQYIYLSVEWSGCNYFKYIRKSVAQCEEKLWKFLYCFDEYQEKLNV